MHLITRHGLALPAIAVSMAVAVTAGAQVADLHVEKTGPFAASPGDSVYYNIRVTNNGPDTADGPQVVDSFPDLWTIDYFNVLDSEVWDCMVPDDVTGDIICEAPSLDAGLFVDFQLSISDSDLLSQPGDTVVNIVTVSSGTTDPDTSNNQASVSTLLADPTDMKVLKDDGVTTVAPGDTVTYTITVSVEFDAAAGVVVTDLVPPGLSACTWTCTGAACSGVSGTGDIQETIDLDYLVAASAVYELTCEVDATAIGSITNVATATLPPGLYDLTPEDNTASDTDAVTPTADLSVTKTDGVTSVVAGGETTYTIVASNAGPSSVTGAVLTDAFPAELTCDWSCAGAACPAASGSGDLSASLDLTAGESVTYTAACTVAAEATDSVSNTASIAVPTAVTDPDPANNSATDVGEVIPPVGPGMVTTYSIVIDTNGNGVPDPDDQRLELNELPEGLSIGGGPWGMILLSSADSDGDGILDEFVYFHPGGLTQIASFTASSRKSIGGPRTGAAAVAATTGSFSFRELRGDGSTSATGIGALADGDGDGWMDQVVGGGTGLQVEIGFVGSDVTGDGHADYLSIPWSQASLVGVDGSNGAADPQVWIPLADTDGDGIPDSVVFDLDGDGTADPDKLGSPPVQPGLQPGPTVEAIPVLGDWGVLALLTALAAAGWWLLRWRTSAG